MSIDKYSSGKYSLYQVMVYNGGMFDKKFAMRIKNDRSKIVEWRRLKDEEWKLSFGANGNDAIASACDLALELTEQNLEIGCVHKARMSIVINRPF